MNQGTAKPNGRLSLKVARAHPPTSWYARFWSWVRRRT